jgi:hypothetical protein
MLDGDSWTLHTSSSEGEILGRANDELVQKLSAGRISLIKDER